MATAIAVILVIVARSAWVTEDAYITLRTVDNWVSGYGLRWNVDERVQGYTHPLWMFLLTVFYAFTHEAFFTTVALGIAVTAAALWVLARAARSPHHALLALGFLGVSRAFTDFSTSGLENPLSHLLLALFVWAYAVRRAPLVWLTGLAALLALNRMDTLLVVAPALAHTSLSSLRARGVKPTLVALGVGLSPLVAWEFFSLFYYGALVPNTAFAKLNTGIPARALWQQGFVYLGSMLAWDPALLVGLALGLALAVAGAGAAELALGLGALLYVVYTVRVGGDFMIGRFFTVPLFTAALLMVRTELALDKLRAVAPLLLPLGFLWLHPSGREVWPVDNWPRTGIADERAFYREHASLMMATRRSTPPTSPWAEEGRALRRDHVDVTLSGTIGYRGYYAGPSVHIIDALGLTDPLLARLPARHDPDWRVGHYMRTLPTGYLESVRTGVCKMDDPDLCSYWRALTLVNAGPLWSGERLWTLARLMLGKYDSLIDVERYRHPAPQSESLLRVAQLRAPNQPYDGLCPVPDAGIAVELGYLSRARSMRVSLGRGDEYELLFQRAGRTLARLEVSAGERDVHHLEVPAQARSEGFQQLVIRPLSGDGNYAAGALEFYEEGAETLSRLQP